MAYMNEISYIDQSIIDKIYNLKQFVPHDKPEIRGMDFQWSGIDFFAWITPNGIRRLRIKNTTVPQHKFLDLPHFKSQVNSKTITAIAVELVACNIHNN